MSKRSIIMVGPFPPPIGGVSIHTSRLINKIKEKYIVYKINTSGNIIYQGLLLLILLVKSRLSSSKYTLHNHMFRLKINCIIILLCKIFGIPYIQTIHSFRFEKKMKSKDIRMIKFIINNSYKTIVVSKEIKKKLEQLDRGFVTKIEIIPAFIPYENNESFNESEYLETLQINDFLKSHSILLCANASKITFYKNEDLYGIDLCIELMRKIKQLKNYNIGFIFMLPQVLNEEYFEKMKSQIKEFGIEDDFIFINKKVELVPLFRYLDIFIRPTNTDGDALSIRESLFSGIPCIASDVVERPLGTITFKNRDIDDLFEKVIAVIGNLEEEKKKIKRLQESHNLIYMYYKIYDKF